MGWRIVTYRVPAEPSRHRVAVWRELRKVGAVSLQAGPWAMSDGDLRLKECSDVLEDVAERVYDARGRP